MQPERIVTVAAMRGEFGRLVRGLEVEGWSIEELREALGIMSECIRAADADGVRAWQRWLADAHGRVSAWTAYCDTRQEETMRRIWARIEAERAERNGMVNRPVRNGG